MSTSSAGRLKRLQGEHGDAPPVGALVRELFLWCLEMVPATELDSRYAVMDQVLQAEEPDELGARVRAWYAGMLAGRYGRAKPLPSKVPAPRKPLSDYPCTCGAGDSLTGHGRGCRRGRAIGYRRKMGPLDPA